MPSRSGYTGEENRIFATAYANATSNPTQGADQTSTKFWEKVMENIELLEPHPSPDTYSLRGLAAIQRQVSKIKREIQAFSKSLIFIKVCQPTGVDQQQILNLAIAHYKKAMSKLNYSFKNYDAHKWKFFAAYKVLRRLDQFADPTGSTTADGEET